MIVTGFLVRETAFLFGARGDSGDVARHPRRVAASLACARPRGGSGRHVCLVALLQGRRVGGQLRAVSALGRGLSDPARQRDRDVTVYMAAGGLPALKTAMCDNFSPTRKYPFACTAGVLAPTLFLVVANDIGRWLILAVFCAWLLSALIVIRQTGRIAASSRSTATGAAAFGVILALEYTRYNDVNLAAREFIAAHWPKYCAQP